MSGILLLMTIGGSIIAAILRISAFPQNKTWLRTEHRYGKSLIIGRRFAND